MLNNIQNDEFNESQINNLDSKIKQVEDILDSINQNNQLDQKVSHDLSADIQNYIESTKQLIDYLLSIVNTKINEIDNLIIKLNNKNQQKEKFKQKLKKIIFEKKELEQLAYTDKLTWLFNRHKLEKIIEVLLNQNRSKWISFSLIDLDNFKAINSTYWQFWWDEVLIHFSKLMKDFFWENNKDYLLFRIGWEEFWIISSIPINKFHLSIEKFLHHTINHPCKLKDGRKVKISFSWSTASSRDTEGNIRTRDEIEWKLLSEWLLEAKSTWKSKIIAK